MLKTDLQFYVFIACITFGGILGIIFSLKDLLLFRKTNEKLKIFIDVSAFLFGGVLYVVYSHLLRFPNFRAFMVASVFVGLMIYNKTFRIMLANIFKKGYNVYINKRTKTNERKRI